MDVISMHQAGIATAVCACGTALTPDQVKLISQYADEVILSYDSDEAGQKATLRSLELFRNSPVRVGVLQIPGAKDPDEYIKKYGADRFKALLDGVGNALDFRMKRLRDALREQTRVLDSVSYERVLARGFALVTTGDGGLVRSAGAVADGDALKLRFADGEVGVTAGGGSGGPKSAPPTPATPEVQRPRIRRRTTGGDQGSLF